MFRMKFVNTFTLLICYVQDEMLVFMEFCDRGTLEEAAKMGLNELNVRLYTRELLFAINHLHDHNIVHRDIKGVYVLSGYQYCTSRYQRCVHGTSPLVPSFPSLFFQTSDGHEMKLILYLLVLSYIVM